MGVEDLYAQQPVAADPLSLGVGPAPVAPALPAPSIPVTQQPNQKAVTLAAIAAMIAGGPSMSGVGHGVLQAQRGMEEERRYKDRLQMQRYEQEQQNYDFQQRQYQARLQQQQQALMTAIGAVRQGVTQNVFKTEDDYNKHVDQTAALLQNVYGMRITPDFIRQSARYFAPDDAQIIYSQLEKAFKTPLSGQDFKPTDTINYKSPTGPKTLTLGEAVKQSDFPVVLGPDGNFRLAGNKPMTPTEAAGIPGAFVAARSKYKTLGYTDEAADAKAREDVQKQQVEFERAKAAARESVKPPKEVDPALEAIRQLTLQQKQNAVQNQPSFPPNVQRRIDTKAKAFDSQPVVKRTQTMAEAVSFADKLPDDTKNPADDQALIYAFAKAMDPDSVVREGEYATVQKYAQSWAQSMGFNAARIFSNTAFLTPAARRNMKTTIRNRYAAARAQYDNVKSSYAKQIDGVTGKPGTGADMLTSYEDAFPSTEPDVPPSNNPAADSARSVLERRRGAGTGR